LPSTAGEKFQKLVDIMARLRAPGGCPWDREQTFDTIKPYLLEETYEVMDAIDARDRSPTMPRIACTAPRSAVRQLTPPTTEKAGG
jgi:NTP pyrophosphatase (non-canonical NTP hydrolase)